MEVELNQDIIERVIQNAQSMLGDLPVSKDIEILQLGFFDFMKKKKLTQDFKSLYLALWRFALDRSFPDSSKILYDHFIDTAWPWAISTKKETTYNAELYYEKLQEKGLDDFTVVARHLLSFVEYDEAHRKAYTLKLSLLIRSRYTFFFDHLLHF